MGAGPLPEAQTRTTRESGGKGREKGGLGIPQCGSQFRRLATGGVNKNYMIHLHMYEDHAKPMGWAGEEENIQKFSAGEASGG